MDEAFLERLFVASRPELGALLTLGEPGRQLVEMQRRAQRSAYLAAHPRAEDHVVELADRTPVARCWTAQNAEAVWLLDLAVEPHHRRRGVAAAALTTLIAHGDRLGLPVRLHVWHENRPARTLYLAMGFHETGVDGGHLAMERPPVSPRGAA